jgi:small-conductance mechanosensitive channel
MDAFLTTVVGGVIVAIVGAIAAFYFGGLRERQRLAHERYLEDQRRLEERESQLEEREQEEQERLRKEQEKVSERRTQAINEILARAHKVVADVRALGNRASSLPEKERELDGPLTVFGAKPVIERLRLEWQQILEQRDAVTNEIESLRSYYLAQESHLLPATRNLFESFDKDFDERYTPLSAQLASRQSLSDKSWPVGIYALPFTETFKAKNKFFPEWRDVKQKNPEMMKTAKNAQEWDFREYQSAFSRGYHGEQGQDGVP